MSGLLHDTQLASVPAGDERWALVQRIAASRQLGKASQLRDILLYICRRALLENASSISEQEIGCKVLGRRLDFNPNEDNIVRAQVRHLRRKLEEYFATDGTQEPLLLTIPKGGYIPHFEERTARPAPPPVLPVTKPRHTKVVAGLVLAGLAIAAAGVWWREETLHRATPDATLGTDPLQRIFVPGRETSLVMADTCMVMLQDILDVDVPLSDYLSGGYPEKLIAPVSDPQLHAALKMIAGRQYTSLGDATIAAKLMEVSHRYAARTNIRYSRHISIREFRTGNFILIGSRRGVPWVQLFEPRLNFSLEEDHQTQKYYFRNRVPMAGEERIYGGNGPTGPNADTYADIALLPNLAGNGYVLTLAGIDMAATEAAGDLVARTDFPASVNRALATRPHQPPPSSIELLLKAKVMGGTTADATIVAYRALP